MVNIQNNSNNMMFFVQKLSNKKTKQNKQR